MADKSKPVPFIKDLRVAMHKHLGGERCPATVTVYEAIEPVATSYALRFQVEADGVGHFEGTLGFKSLLNMVSAWSHGEMSKQYRLTDGSKGKAIDAAMRKWFVSGIPPERSILVQWVLWRTLLGTASSVGASKGAAGSLCFVGSEDVASGTGGEQDGSHNGLHEPLSDHDDQSLVSGEDQDMPPTYDSAYNDPDEPPPPPYSESGSVYDNLGPPPPYEDDDRSPSVTELGGAEGYQEWDRDLLIAHRRVDSVRTADKSGWDPYRWRLTMELSKSKRDMEEMRDLRRRQKAVRRAREIEVLGKMNSLRHRQKNEAQQNRKNKQMVCDVLDLHEMMETMRRESKRLSCQILKDKEKVIMVKQPYCLQRGKHQKGAHLGDGPIPYPATSKLSDNPESRVAKQYRWDAQGRRHKKDGVTPRGNFYEEAMKVIISLSSSGFERHMCLHRAFEHFDANGDGKVTLSEFATALQLLKPKPTTEQLMTLFRFFDPNNTGAMVYGEFLTQFFSRRKFLKDMATDKPPPTQVHKSGVVPSREGRPPLRNQSRHGDGKPTEAKTGTLGTRREKDEPGKRGASVSSASRKAEVRRPEPAVKRSMSVNDVKSQVQSLQRYMESMNHELEELIKRGGGKGLLSGRI